MLSDDKLEKAIKAVSAMDVKSGVSQHENGGQHIAGLGENIFLGASAALLLREFLNELGTFLNDIDAQYQRLALRTASEESMKDPLLNGLLGLGGKTGECQDLYKKHRFQDRSVPPFVAEWSVRVDDPDTRHKASPFPQAFHTDRSCSIGRTRQTAH